MGFSEAVRRCFSNYLAFSGRARRPEFWWFMLFVFLGSAITALLDRMLFGTGAGPDDARGPVSAIFSLAVFLPVLAVGWRRLHDTGRPGWYFIGPLLISVIAMIAMFGGIAGFTLLERRVAEPQDLVGPAGILGTTGMILAGLAQLVISLILLWWLTRPSDAGANAYGPPPQP